MLRLHTHFHSQESEYVHSNQLFVQNKKQVQEKHNQYPNLFDIFTIYFPKNQHSHPLYDSKIDYLYPLCINYKNIHKLVAVACF
jgi:hypothetical protein